MDDNALHDAGKHGLVGGYVPERADWTIPQNWQNYTTQEHATWRTLFERQARQVQGRAAHPFLDGLNRLPIAADVIPDFDALSDELMKATRWQVVAVPGLVPDDVFFDHLANRRFPAGQFIRQPQQLDYLQEPDVFHDVFGHVPMLMNPVMADFIQAYGVGGLRAQKRGVLDRLARLYWYTVEFGLVAEDGEVRILGAGIVSSFAETRFALEDPSPHRIGFDLARVMRTQYRIDDFQQIYFVLPSLDCLLDLAQTDFAPVYDAIANLSDLAPHDILRQDRIIHRGSVGA